MSRLAIGAAKAVLILAVAGGVVVQTAVIPTVWADLREVSPAVRLTVVVACVGWIACMQLVAACVWRLLTMVSAGSVFSARAFRPVDVIIGAALVASVLTAVLATLLVPGDAAPGLVGIVYGLALAIAGVALIIVVMRALLRQAIEMRSELAEVV
ncbi:DUF2975 domain-containing protein [Microbacterium sp.]|uniref:DUF2975 domain-containing protein n=1 Tax=Microbacterium sp. TaxID=51671 RepID=UPI00373689B5